VVEVVAMAVAVAVCSHRDNCSSRNGSSGGS
jgi:hypothetical protein